MPSTTARSPTRATTATGSRGPDGAGRPAALPGRRAGSASDGDEHRRARRQVDDRRTRDVGLLEPAQILVAADEGRPLVELIELHAGDERAVARLPFLLARRQRPIEHDDP